MGQVREGLKISRMEIIDAKLEIVRVEGTFKRPSGGANGGLKIVRTEWGE